MATLRSFRRSLGSRALVLVVLAAAPLITACEPNYANCPTAGSGQVRVAVVVDARALGATQHVVCVVVPAGSNGLTALQARATRLDTPQPRIHPNGLVCAIDGRPEAPACGESGPDGPEYWSYWLGGTTWSYATVGPAARTVQDQTVDGWRFIDGGPNAPPTMSSSFATLTA